MLHKTLVRATTLLAKLTDESFDAGQPDPPVVVHAAGELDLDTVETFRTQVSDAVNSSSSTEVVADLTDVTFIDSTTLGILVRAHKQLTEQGRHLTIRGPQPLVVRLLEITGLSTVLDIEA